MRYRSWRTLYLQRSTSVPVFSRVALVFRARSEADAAALASEGAGGGSGWARRLLAPLRRRVVKVAEAVVSSRHLYLKLFRVRVRGWRRVGGGVLGWGHRCRLVDAGCGGGG